MHWYHYAIVVLTIVGGGSLITYANRLDTSQTSQVEQSQQMEYEYAELGSQCNLAAIKLKHKSEALKSQSEKDYASINNELNQTQAELSATATYYAQTDLQSEINRLRTENVKHYEESKKRAAEYLADASKLDSCAASATAEKQFTVSDVAEFEALISKAEQP